MHEIDYSWLRKYYCTQLPTSPQ